MKKIEAIVRPEMVGLIRESLEKIGVNGMTIIRVDGRGRQKGLVQKYNGSTHHVEFLPKTKIEIFVKDEDAKKAVDTIRDAANTGQVGDGKIVVYPLEEIVRIRTGERGIQAL